MVHFSKSWNFPDWEWVGRNGYGMGDVYPDGYWMWIDAMGNASFQNPKDGREYIRYNHFATDKKFHQVGRQKDKQNAKSIKEHQQPEMWKKCRLPTIPEHRKEDSYAPHENTYLYTYAGLYVYSM